MSNHDDLGVDGGRFEFRHGGQARQSVMNWSIVGFGNRPCDHMARDLLFGALERDPRLWAWRTLCKQKPPWMFHDTFGLPEASRARIAQQRSLHLLHQAHWLDLLDDADDQAASVIGQLRSCWPAGALVGWRGEGAASRGNCRRPHHCPFCFAREVVQLYQQAVRAIPPAPGQRGFFLLTATVTDDELNEAGILETYDFVRLSVLPAIQHEVRSLGAHGGLVTSQVGPLRWTARQWNEGELATSRQHGFEHHLGVLGEFDVEPAILTQLRSRRVAPEIRAGGVTIRPKLSVVNHQSNTSLRILLTGHLAAYKGRQHLTDGRGLFVWPSLVLANYPQWRERLDLLKGRHLYDRWGTWIGMAPVSRRPHLPMGRRRRTGAARRLDTIRRINDGRERHAEDRVRDLMQRHGELLREIEAQTGRRPGRSVIISSFQRAGINVSDKDSRRIALFLKRESLS